MFFQSGMRVLQPILEDLVSLVSRTMPWARLGWNSVMVGGSCFGPSPAGPDAAPPGCSRTWTGHVLCVGGAAGQSGARLAPG